MPYPFNHTPQVLDTPNHMPTQTNQIYYIPYTDIIVFIWVKHTSHQNIKSSRAASFPVVFNTVDNNWIFDTKHAEIRQNGRCTFIFHHSTCSYKHLYNFHRQSLPLLHPVSLHYLITKPSYSTHQYSFPLYHIQFSSLYFCIQLFLTIPTKSYFPYLIHSANSGCVKGPISGGTLWMLTMC